MTSSYDVTFAWHELQVRQRSRDGRHPDLLDATRGSNLSRHSESRLSTVNADVAAIAWLEWAPLTSVGAQIVGAGGWTSGQKSPASSSEEEVRRVGDRRILESAQLAPVTGPGPKARSRSKPIDAVVNTPVEFHRTLDALLLAVRDCRACATHLPLGPRPVLQAGASARVLIVGQAPGARVHSSGIPWDDRSGERLRAWMGIEARRFYDRFCVAIVPMGLCYPGRAASGDLPPRRECAPLWLDRLLAQLPRIELTLLVGAHAQAHFLRAAGHASVTATTRNWRTHYPRVVPLPHPSPRNVAWFKANPWFDHDLVPVLRQRVHELLGD